MSYNEFIEIIRGIIHGLDGPRVLEIGLEHGAITIPLLNLLVAKKSFYYRGIDIEIKDGVREFVSSLNNDNIVLVEDNSLKELPKIKNKFDLILVDGDHNYYTVSHELKYITNMIHDETVIICDDYHTPYDVNDYWYSNYIDNELATKPVVTEKTGVMPAIEEWAQEMNMTVHHMDRNSKKLIHANDIDPEDISTSYCHAVMLRKEKK